MTWDANLVLADTTLDWNKTNTDSYGTPNSTTRNDGGFIVLDLGAFGGTAVKGMVATFIADEVANAAGDALTLIIEASDQADFSSELEVLAAFGIDGANGSGVIDGDETPCTISRIFSTNRRYIRCKATMTASDDFKTCQVLLSPWGMGRSEA